MGIFKMANIQEKVFIVGKMENFMKAIIEMEVEKGEVDMLKNSFLMRGNLKMVTLLTSMKRIKILFLNNKVQEIAIEIDI